MEGEDYDADGDGEPEINFVQFVRMMAVSNEEANEETTAKDVMKERCDHLRSLLETPPDDRTPALVEEIAEVLRNPLQLNISFYADMALETCLVCCRELTLVTAPPGHVLYKQGDVAFCFNILLEGEVDLWQSSNSWSLTLTLIGGRLMAEQ